MYRINNSYNQSHYLTTRYTNKSLERLSSGLRINKAADDSSSMQIADSLRADHRTKFQTIQNLNDAIGLAQIADKAIDEMTKIIDRLKIKLVEMVNDSESTESKQAIIDELKKLTEAYDNISNTTKYNGQTLLSSFFNKKFAIDSKKSLDITIQNTNSKKIGNTNFLVTPPLPIDPKVAFGDVRLTFKNVDGTHDVELETVKIGYKNGEGLGTLAEVINKNADKTGVRATYKVEHEHRTKEPVRAGTTPSDFSINDVLIGAIDVKDNDKDGSLANAINSLTYKTGVEATILENGRLKLTSVDGRAIKISSKDMQKLDDMRIANYNINQPPFVWTNHGIYSQNDHQAGLYRFTIPKGTTGIRITNADNEDVDTLQLFTKDGKHLVGTPDALPELDSSVSGD